MKIEEFSEMRIANAFNLPSQLTIADCAEMQRRTIAESKAWKTRKRREEEAGGFDEQYNKRQKNYQRRAKWMKRRINDADRAVLLGAWTAI